MTEEKINYNELLRLREENKILKNENNRLKIFINKITNRINNILTE